MERKKRVEIGGAQHDVTEIGFRESGEHWNEYLADDGSVIRVKLVVTEIMRLDDQFDELGNPRYFVKSTNVMNVSSTEDMRREMP